MTVNKEAMRAWVEALRSGELKQTQMVLHRRDPDVGDSFCCLGVACVVAIKAGVTVRREHGRVNVLYDSSASVLPTPVARWLGVMESGDVYMTHPDGEAATGMAANDTLSWDFGRIADALEYTYLRDETEYLLSGPNGERLSTAVENLEAGGGKEHTLIEEAEL